MLQTIFDTRLYERIFKVLKFIGIYMYMYDISLKDISFLFLSNTFHISEINL